jgi:hypothetical protein
VHQTGHSERVSPASERRQQSWDRMVRWASEHRRVARLAPWFMGTLSSVWALITLVEVLRGSIGAAAYYGVATLLGVWTTYSWVRILRREPRPTGWPG